MSIRQPTTFVSWPWLNLRWKQNAAKTATKTGETVTTQKTDPFALTLEEFQSLDDATQQAVRRQGSEALSAEAFAYLDSTGKEWVVYCGNPPKVAMEGQDILAPSKDVLRTLGEAYGSLPWVFTSGVETGEIDAVEIPTPSTRSASPVRPRKPEDTFRKPLAHLPPPRRWHRGDGYMPM